MEVAAEVIASVSPIWLERVKEGYKDDFVAQDLLEELQSSSSAGAFTLAGSFIGMGGNEL